jgi:hypothetical protein
LDEVELKLILLELVYHDLCSRLLLYSLIKGIACDLVTNNSKCSSVKEAGQVFAIPVDLGIIFTAKISCLINNNLYCL